MPVLDKNLQKIIDSYVTKPILNESDKRWHLTYTDLNTNAKYNVRFITQQEALVFYKKIYTNLINIVMNIINAYQQGR